ncbi:MAG: sigma-70 family RNA polymerase sigma factor [Butyrivibrio sp.]|nr:sigma-70 family RNA polymerase sigma factor [Muribaculum sp.]MCM1553567.1 sigma-70 family RNA polymerase sigma factor [Butyrivibrio sp.]
MQDNDIIELFWLRDEAAIVETDRKYGRYCRRIAMNLLENEEDANECVNDTWFKVWNAIPNERPRYFQGFLSKITRHIAINRWKNQTAIKRGSGAVALALEELGECVSGTSTVESEYEAKELSEAIDAFINRLPEKEQCIFIWRYFYLESVQSIAKCMGLRANNVSVILSRTRNKLKLYLQEKGYEL